MLFPTLASPAPPTRSRRRRAEAWSAYLLLAPALLLLAVWFLYPIVSSFLLSVQRVNVFHYSQRTFVGFANFASLLDDRVFHSTVRITVTFVVIVVPVQTIASLLLASMVNGVDRFKTLYRTLLFIPYITSTVAMTAVFMDLFTVHRLIPGAFALIGVPDVSWFADVRLALVFVAVIYVWMNLGLYMVIFLAGLQTVPLELYEAVRVDGGNRLQELLFVTIPSLRPFITFVVISGIIAAFQIFDQAYVVSGGTVLGGPAGATSTIVIYIFAEAFRYNKLGPANAAAVLLLIAISVLTLVVRSLVRDRSDEA